MRKLTTIYLAVVPAWIVLMGVLAWLLQSYWFLGYAVAGAVVLGVWLWSEVSSYDRRVDDLHSMAAQIAKMYPTAQETSVLVKGLRVAHAELAAKLPDIDPSSGNRAVRVESSEVVAEYRALTRELAEAERKYAETVLEHDLLAERFNESLGRRWFRYVDDGDTKLAKRPLIGIKGG